MTRKTTRLGVIAFAAVFGVAGCDFEVKNPGRILDVDLNSSQAVSALVTGMSSDLSTALDDVAFTIARASDEMAGSGSYTTTGLFRTGVFENDLVDFEWNATQRARWVAEDGLRRMRDDIKDEDFVFDGDKRTARGFLLAGFANRLLGEAFCDVTLDGSGALPVDSAFARAEAHFTESIRQATLANDNEILDAAYGGRAQARVGLGNWAGAMSDAGNVATDFVYWAIFSDNSGRENNEFWNETWGRPEISAFNTFTGSFVPPDPRAPWTDCPATGGCAGNDVGADGLTPHFRQDKYDEKGSDIALVKGTEMRLIEAEGELVLNSDFSQAMNEINEARDEFTLPNLTAADINEAWVHLDNERHLTLWLEGRRFFDMRRWQAAGLNNLPAVQFISGGTIVYTGVANRAVCIPIAFSECQTNLELKDSPACAG